MSSDSFITWNDNDSGDKAKAFEKFSDSIESYDGVSRASNRDFLNVEPNRSVRPSYTNQDYYAFRQEEEIPKKEESKPAAPSAADLLSSLEEDDDEEPVVVTVVVVLAAVGSA